MQEMNIMKFVIPVILTFIAGLLLWLIKRDRLSLEYDVAESEIFQHDDGYGKYFILSLKNNGNKAAENITYKIELNHGVIDSLQFSKPDLIVVGTQNESMVTGTIELLNPKEELRTTVTIKNARDFSRISVEVRGVGVTAVEKKTDSIPDYFQKILVVMTIAISISILFFVMTSLNQSEVNKSIANIKGIQMIGKDIEEISSQLEEKIAKRLKELTESQKELKMIKRQHEEQELKRKQGEPTREQIIFAILNKAGLSKILPDLLSTSGEGLSYWKTGLFLIHSYLIDTKNTDRYVTALSEMAKTEIIAPSSKGFLLYLAGKIEKEEGKTSKAIEYFDMCKKETPLMYEHLMAQDPAYDLKLIQVWLENQKDKLK